MLKGGHGRSLRRGQGVMGTGAAVVFLGARMTMGRDVGGRGCLVSSWGPGGGRGHPPSHWVPGGERERPRALPRLVAKQHRGGV